MYVFSNLGTGKVLLLLIFFLPHILPCLLRTAICEVLGVFGCCVRYKVQSHFSNSLLIPHFLSRSHQQPSSDHIYLHRKFINNIPPNFCHLPYFINNLLPNFQFNYQSTSHRHFQLTQQPSRPRVNIRL